MGLISGKIFVVPASALASAGFGSGQCRFGQAIKALNRQIFLAKAGFTAGQSSFTAVPGGSTTASHQPWMKYMYSAGGAQRTRDLWRHWHAGSLLQLPALVDRHLAVLRCPQHTPCVSTSSNVVQPCMAAFLVSRMSRRCSLSTNFSACLSSPSSSMGARCCGIPIKM
jgi:hypothetical protein